MEDGTEMGLPLPYADARAAPRRRLTLGSDRVFWAICLVPPLVILTLVYLYPLAYGFRDSLTNKTGRRDAQFVGLDNYRAALSDDNVLSSIQTTLVFTGLALAVELLIGFVLALLLRLITRGRGLLRTMIIMPIMLTPVVMGLQWRTMLNYDLGIVNYFVQELGFPRMRWLLDAHQAMASIVAIDVWLNTGFVMLVLSAGLAVMPDEIFEAAKVDGASWWRQLVDITIPLLKPVIVVVLLFRAFNLLRAFDIVFSLTQGGPGRATQVLSAYVFDFMFRFFRIGYSTAIAFVLLAITSAVGVFLVFFVDVEDSAAGQRR